MTNRHSIIVITIAAIVSAGIWMLGVRKDIPGKTGISAKVFEGKNGWGYDIMVNGTLFIHQPSVPGLPGNKGFPTKKQAVEMSKLIINKMERGQHPTVTTFELEQIFPANERRYDQPIQ